MPITLTSLFEIVYIYFARPLSTSYGGCKYDLIDVENLNGWEMARVTTYLTSETVMDFMKEEIMNQFGPPKLVVSDNKMCFTARMKSFMEIHGTTWRTVLEYDPMRNGGEDRMVGTLKTAIRKLVLRSSVAWDNALRIVVFG